MNIEKKIERFLDKESGLLEEFYNYLNQNQKKNEPKFSINDQVWGFLNNRALTQAAKNDFQSSSYTYYLMALFVAEIEGKSPTTALTGCQKMSLYEKQNGYSDSVTIIPAGNGCDSCNALSGTVLTIKEALKTMPLPHKDCTFDLFGNGISFCRCLYIAKPISFEKRAKDLGVADHPDVKKIINQRKKVKKDSLSKTMAKGILGILGVKTK